MKSTFIKSLQRKLLYLFPFFMLGGYLCRNYQLQNELLHDGGLIQGAFMHRVLLLLSIIVPGIILLVLHGKKKLTAYKETLAVPSIHYVIPQLASGFLLIAGNVLDLISETEPPVYYTSVSVSLTKYLPYLGILAGFMVMLFAILSCEKKRTPSAALYMAVTLYLTVRLIVFFQLWNTDPSVHDYAFTFLSAITSMLACLHISGFCLNKGNRRVGIFWCLSAGFFSAVSLADYSENVPNFLICTALMLLCCVLGLQLVLTPVPAQEDPVEEDPHTEESSDDQ